MGKPNGLEKNHELEFLQKHDLGKVLLLVSGWCVVGQGDEKKHKLEFLRTLIRRGCKGLGKD